ncbi:MAG TPA: SDR family NAD(P)-dependent oxidoreductase, partial [Saprospiraceae bacterium]|nr:SDR family NAD(P)-dependent oxidoreductase [Saprospiraceae bacterium]
MSIFDKFQLAGKTAVITGASKGIGEGIARALGQAGAKVVVSSRKQEAVEAIAAELRSEGIDALAVAANIGSADDLQRLAEKSLAHFG